MFSNLGLGSAIVQKQDIDNRQLSTLFWIGLAGGIFSAVLIALSAYPISWFYDEPKLFRLTLVLAINFLISPLYQINRKLLEKDLRFSALAASNVIASLVSGGAGVVSAFSGLGVWSLVIQSIILNVSFLFLYFLQRKWIPEFVFEINRCRELIRFGTHMVGSNLALYFERNLDSMIIGKLLGATLLGYYTLAIRVMYLPIRQISYIFTDVLFPVFSKVNADLDTVRKGYLKAIRFTSMITFPLMTLIYLFSDTLVASLVGPKWLPSAEIIRILAPAGAIQSVVQIGWVVFPAMNLPDVRMKLGMYNVISIALAVVIGSNWGIKGVSGGILLSRVGIFVVSKILLSRVLNTGFTDLLHNLKNSTMGCFIILICYLSTNLVLNGDLNKMIVVILLSVFYLFCYLLYIWIFSREDVLYVFGKQ